MPKTGFPFQKREALVIFEEFGAGGRTRTDMSVTSPDFESGAYTNFATPARRMHIIRRFRMERNTARPPNRFNHRLGQSPEFVSCLQLLNYSVAAIYPQRKNMFATRGPSRLECLSRIRGGVYFHLFPSKTHEPSSTKFTCRHVLPIFRRNQCRHPCRPEY